MHAGNTRILSHASHRIHIGMFTHLRGWMFTAPLLYNIHISINALSVEVVDLLFRVSATISFYYVSNLVD